MLKFFLKKIYYFLPSSIKRILLDSFFYLSSTRKGAINIRKIDFLKCNDSAVILGNGPSLNSDREEIKQLVNNNDFVCVNNFCDDELYVLLKPTLYVFLDAYFFSENAHDTWISRREKTFKVLSEDTTWAMNIIVPQSANLEIIQRGIKNDKIKITKINTQSLFTSKLTAFQNWLFDLGFYGPPQINVLIYGIYIPVVAGYKKIRFYGADLSFHNDVQVDQNSNDLYIEYKHFNEKNTTELLKKNPEKAESWKMAELMKLTSDTFFAHEIINSYALKKGVYIENSSSYSLIDAYPRTEKSNIK
ncbi:MAG: hypothetical protein ACI846_000031 [Pseudoalteromonas distincta]|jgi:hypothetical protein